jgi:thiamine transporter ThiT
LLILDQGDWLGYSCLARSTFIFSKWFGLLAAGTYLFAVLAGFNLWAKVAFKGDPLLSYERKALPYLGWAAALLIAYYSAYTATTWNRDVLSFDGSTLTETGCYALQPYAQTFALAGASVEFRNYIQKGRDRSEMVVKTADSQRSLVVDLFTSKFPANLLRFAPHVMEAYVQRLRKDGEPVPAQLQSL